MTTSRRRNMVAAAICLASALVCIPSRASEVQKKETYGLIFGTAYGPDDRPLYGVRVTIHPVGKKHPSWEQQSDHHGEFAQRVPPGPGDYEVRGAVDWIPLEDGKPKKSKTKHLKGATKVHIDGEERKDFSLHLTE